MALLEVEGITGGYDALTVLRELRFSARAGEISCIMGRNGAGKTSLLRAIMGQLRLSGGRIMLGSEVLSALPAHKIAAQGVGYVPQGRRLFTGLSVAENLSIGLMAGGKGEAEREAALSLFPRLRERLAQRAETLSGGEQQMLAIARALCLGPKLLLLDEPTEGLQPSMIALIQETLLRLRTQGMAVVLVEQRVDAVLAMADQVSFMAQGQVQASLPARDLSRSAPEFRHWVGV